MQEIKTIGFVGSGNVATNLAMALYNKGFPISGICNRTASNARFLAKKVKSKKIDAPKSLIDSSDLIILAVSDDAIENMGKELANSGTPVVHTSGLKPMEALKGIPTIGVFYPLQSLKKDSIMNFRDIPILIESNDSEFKSSLIQLAKGIADRVEYLDSSQRAQLHLAAVFANNFTNKLFAISQEICHENKIPFDLLHPLVLKTAEQVTKGRASHFQTGPAIRKDDETIQKHLELLKENEKIKELYIQITELIQEDE